MPSSASNYTVSMYVMFTGAHEFVFAMVPTPGKTFRPYQPKNSVAGEKILHLVKYTQISQYECFFKDSQCNLLG
jgi:hypothetical protein